MPGSTGNATAAGDARIGLMQVPLYLNTQTLGAGAVFTSKELTQIALPGLSIAFTNLSAVNAMSVQVQYSVRPGVFVNLGPAIAVAAATTIFPVAFFHLASRAARFIVTGVAPGDTFTALLSATAS